MICISRNKNAKFSFLLRKGSFYGTYSYRCLKANISARASARAFFLSSSSGKTLSRLSNKTKIQTCLKPPFSFDPPYMSSFYFFATSSLLLLQRNMKQRHPLNLRDPSFRFCIMLRPYFFSLPSYSCSFGEEAGKKEIRKKKDSGGEEGMLPKCVWQPRDYRCLFDLARKGAKSNKQRSQDVHVEGEKARRLILDPEIENSGNIVLPSDKFFWNQTFDKGRLKNFILWFLLKYGEHKTIKLVEELKTLGFQYATKAGISLGIEDLKIPIKKNSLIMEAELLSIATIKQYKRSEITGVERFQRLIDTWHRTSERLKQDVIENFEATDILNPVYMMAFSGARGNISQVRQLVGMRGLMSNPQGQIIDFPIRSNFREGLTLTEYIISSYGARKGIVDTALRTANAGYLTRRLVDVAQHVIISNFDCGTKRGIFLTDMKEGNKTIYSLQNRLIGRVLARDVFAARRPGKSATSFPLLRNLIPAPSSSSLLLLRRNRNKKKIPKEEKEQGRRGCTFSLLLLLPCFFSEGTGIRRRFRSKEITLPLPSSFWIKKGGRNKNIRPLDLSAIASRLSYMASYRECISGSLGLPLNLRISPSEARKKGETEDKGAKQRRHPALVHSPLFCYAEKTSSFFLASSPRSFILASSPCLLIPAKQGRKRYARKKIFKDRKKKQGEEACYFLSSSHAEVPWIGEEDSAKMKKKEQGRWKAAKKEGLSSLRPYGADSHLFFLASLSLPLRGIEQERREYSDSCLAQDIGCAPFFSSFLFLRSREEGGEEIGDKKRTKIGSRNMEIASDLSNSLTQNAKKVFVRSALTCQTKNLVCQLCYGWSLAQGNLVGIGEAVGVVAAQSIGEPGTQLTMRTFHTGGVFSGDVSDQIRAPFSGIVNYDKPIAGTLIRTPEGKIAFLTKNEGSLTVLSSSPSLTGSKGVRMLRINMSHLTGSQKEGVSHENRFKIEHISKFKIPFYTLLFFKKGEKVIEKEVIAQISSINRQKSSTDQAEFTINAEISGQFFSKLLNLKENKVGPKNNSSWSSLDYHATKNNGHNKPALTYSPRSFFPSYSCSLLLLLLRRRRFRRRRRSKKEIFFSSCSFFSLLRNLRRRRFSKNEGGERAEGGEEVGMGEEADVCKKKGEERRNREAFTIPTLRAGRPSLQAGCPIPTKGHFVGRDKDFPQNTVDTVFEAWGWGYAWVLAGKIYNLPLTSSFFPIIGDFVNNKTYMNKTQLNLPSNLRSAISIKLNTQLINSFASSPKKREYGILGVERSFPKNSFTPSRSQGWDTHSLPPVGEFYLRSNKEGTRRGIFRSYLSSFASYSGSFGERAGEKKRNIVPVGTGKTLPKGQNLSKEPSNIKYPSNNKESYFIGQSHLSVGPLIDTKNQKDFSFLKKELISFQLEKISYQKLGYFLKLSQGNKIITIRKQLQSSVLSLEDTLFLFSSLEGDIFLSSLPSERLANLTPFPLRGMPCSFSSFILAPKICSFCSFSEGAGGEEARKKSFSLRISGKEKKNQQGEEGAGIRFSKIQNQKGKCFPLSCFFSSGIFGEEGAEKKIDLRSRIERRYVRCPCHLRWKEAKKKTTLPLVDSLSGLTEPGCITARRVGNGKTSRFLFLATREHPQGKTLRLLREILPGGMSRKGAKKKSFFSGQKAQGDNNFVYPANWSKSFGTLVVRYHNNKTNSVNLAPSFFLRKEKKLKNKKKPIRDPEGVSIREANADLGEYFRGCKKEQGGSFAQFAEQKRKSATECCTFYGFSFLSCFFSSFSSFSLPSSKKEIRKKKDFFLASSPPAPSEKEQKEQIFGAGGEEEARETNKKAVPFIFLNWFPKLFYTNSGGIILIEPLFFPMPFLWKGIPLGSDLLDPYIGIYTKRKSGLCQNTSHLFFLWDIPIEDRKSYGIPSLPPFRGLRRSFLPFCMERSHCTPKLRSKKENLPSLLFLRSMELLHGKKIERRSRNNMKRSKKEKKQPFILGYREDPIKGAFLMVWDPKKRKLQWRGPKFLSLPYSSREMEKSKNEDVINQNQATGIYLYANTTPLRHRILWLPQYFYNLKDCLTSLKEVPSLSNQPCFLFLRSREEACPIAIKNELGLPSLLFLPSKMERRGRNNMERSKKERLPNSFGPELQRSYPPSRLAKLKNKIRNISVCSSPFGWILYINLYLLLLRTYHSIGVNMFPREVFLERTGYGRCSPGATAPAQSSLLYPPSGSLKARKKGRGGKKLEDRLFPLSCSFFFASSPCSARKNNRGEIFFFASSPSSLLRRNKKKEQRARKKGVGTSLASSLLLLRRFAPQEKRFFFCFFSSCGAEGAKNRNKKEAREDFSMFRILQVLRSKKGKTSRGVGEAKKYGNNLFSYAKSNIFQINLQGKLKIFPLVEGYIQTNKSHVLCQTLPPYGKCLKTVDVPLLPPKRDDIFFFGPYFFSSFLFLPSREEGGEEGMLPKTLLSSFAGAKDFLLRRRSMPCSFSEGAGGEGAGIRLSKKEKEGSTLLSCFLPVGEGAQDPTERMLMSKKKISLIGYLLQEWQKRTNQTGKTPGSLRFCGCPGATSDVFGQSFPKEIGSISGSSFLLIPSLLLLLRRRRRRFAFFEEGDTQEKRFLPCFFSSFGIFKEGTGIRRRKRSLPCSFSSFILAPSSPKSFFLRSKEKKKQGEERAGISIRKNEKEGRHSVGRNIPCKWNIRKGRKYGYDLASGEDFPESSVIGKGSKGMRSQAPKGPLWEEEQGGVFLATGHPRHPARRVLRPSPYGEEARKKGVASSFWIKKENCKQKNKKEKSTTALASSFLPSPLNLRRNKMEISKEKKLKSQNNLIIKPGWFYFTNDISKFFLYHKKIFHPGKIIGDGFIFDRESIYLEIISSFSLLLSSSMERNLFSCVSPSYSCSFCSAGGEEAGKKANLLFRRRRKASDPNGNLFPGKPLLAWDISPSSFWIKKQDRNRTVFSNLSEDGSKEQGKSFHYSPPLLYSYGTSASQSSLLGSGMKCLGLNFFGMSRSLQYGYGTSQAVNGTVLSSDKATIPAEPTCNFYVQKLIRNQKCRFQPEKNLLSLWLNLAGSLSEDKKTEENLGFLILIRKATEYNLSTENHYKKEMYKIAHLKTEVIRFLISTVFKLKSYFYYRSGKTPLKAKIYKKSVFVRNPKNKTFWKDIPRELFAGTLFSTLPPGSLSRPQGRNRPFTSFSLLLRSLLLLRRFRSRNKIERNLFSCVSPSSKKANLLLILAKQGRNLRSEVGPCAFPEGGKKKKPASLLPEGEKEGICSFFPASSPPAPSSPPSYSCSFGEEAGKKEEKKKICRRYASKKISSSKKSSLLNLRRNKKEKEQKELGRFSFASQLRAGSSPERGGGFPKGGVKCKYFPIVKCSNTINLLTQFKAGLLNKQKIKFGEGFQIYSVPKGGALHFSPQGNPLASTSRWPGDFPGGGSTILRKAVIQKPHNKLFSCYGTSFFEEARDKTYPCKIYPLFPSYSCKARMSMQSRKDKERPVKYIPFPILDRKKGHNFGIPEKDKAISKYPSADVKVFSNISFYCNILMLKLKLIQSFFFIREVFVGVPDHPPMGEVIVKRHASSHLIPAPSSSSPPSYSSSFFEDSGGEEAGKKEEKKKIPKEEKKQGWSESLPAWSCNGTWEEASAKQNRPGLPFLLLLIPAKQGRFRRRRRSGNMMERGKKERFPARRNRPVVPGPVDLDVDQAEVFHPVPIGLADVTPRLPHSDVQYNRYLYFLISCFFTSFHFPPYSASWQDPSFYRHPSSLLFLLAGAGDTQEKRFLLLRNLFSCVSPAPARRRRNLFSCVANLRSSNKKLRYPCFFSSFILASSALSSCRSRRYARKKISSAPQSPEIAEQKKSFFLRISGSGKKKEQKKQREERAGIRCKEGGRLSRKANPLRGRQECTYSYEKTVKKKIRNWLFPLRGVQSKQISYKSFERFSAEFVPITSISSINLSPLLLSYKTPYALDFPFKTPISFFYEQHTLRSTLFNKALRTGSLIPFFYFFFKDIHSATPRVEHPCSFFSSGGEKEDLPSSAESSQNKKEIRKKKDFFFFSSFFPASSPKEQEQEGGEEEDSEGRERARKKDQVTNLSFLQWDRSPSFWLLPLAKIERRRKGSKKESRNSPPPILPLPSIFSPGVAEQNMKYKKDCSVPTFLFRFATNIKNEDGTRMGLKLSLPTSSKEVKTLLFPLGIRHILDPSRSLEAKKTGKRVPSQLCPFRGGCPIRRGEQDIKKGGNGKLKMRTSFFKISRPLDTPSKIISILSSIFYSPIAEYSLGTNLEKAIDQQNLFIFATCGCNTLREGKKQPASGPYGGLPSFLRSRNTKHEEQDTISVAVPKGDRISVCPPLCLPRMWTDLTNFFDFSPKYRINTKFVSYKTEFESFRNSYLLFGGKILPRKISSLASGPFINTYTYCSFEGEFIFSFCSFCSAGGEEAKKKHFLSCFFSSPWNSSWSERSLPCSFSSSCSFSEDSEGGERAEGEEGAGISIRKNEKEGARMPDMKAFDSGTEITILSRSEEDEKKQNLKYKYKYKYCTRSFPLEKSQLQIQNIPYMQAHLASGKDSCMILTKKDQISYYLKPWDYHPSAHPGEADVAPWLHLPSYSCHRRWKEAGKKEDLHPAHPCTELSFLLYRAKKQGRNRTVFPCYAEKKETYPPQGIVSSFLLIPSFLLLIPVPKSSEKKQGRRKRSLPCSFSSFILASSPPSESSLLLLRRNRNKKEQGKEGAGIRWKKARKQKIQNKKNISWVGGQNEAAKLIFCSCYAKRHPFSSSPPSSPPSSLLLLLATQEKRFFFCFAKNRNKKEEKKNKQGMFLYLTKCKPQRKCQRSFYLTNFPRFKYKIKNNYKENYFSLENLKNKNQYVINDTIIYFAPYGVRLDQVPNIRSVGSRSAGLRSESQSSPFRFFKRNPTGFRLRSREEERREFFCSLFNLGTSAARRAAYQTIIPVGLRMFRTPEENKTVSKKKKEDALFFPPCVCPIAAAPTPGRMSHKKGVAASSLLFLLLRNLRRRSRNKKQALIFTLGHPQEYVPGPPGKSPGRCVCGSDMATAHAPSSGAEKKMERRLLKSKKKKKKARGFPWVAIFSLRENMAKTFQAQLQDRERKSGSSAPGLSELGLLSSYSCSFFSLLFAPSALSLSSKKKSSEQEEKKQKKNLFSCGANLRRRRFSKNEGGERAGKKNSAVASELHLPAREEPAGSSFFEEGPADFHPKGHKINKLPIGMSLAGQRTKLLLGEFLVYGDQIDPYTAVTKSGQIIHINNKKITLRQGQPIFVSPKSTLHKYDSDFIQEQSPVITLSYQQLKTGDIIQGIPKVEQFFEARTTKRGRLFRDSLSNLLKGLFKRYCSKGLPLDQAVRQSFYKIQQIIVHGVQRVYRSQGVSIADKHLEIIVKQMTSKVRIIEGGQTGFFAGEIVDLNFVEQVNSLLMRKITYEPLVLGITKASLQVDSFLSAASFQQTTRILSNAAIYKKKDFLKGLKENVILGNLIPAGTGYLVYLSSSRL